MVRRRTIYQISATTPSRETEKDEASHLPHAGLHSRCLPRHIQHSHIHPFTHLFPIKSPSGKLGTDQILTNDITTNRLPDHYTEEAQRPWRRTGAADVYKGNQVQEGAVQHRGASLGLTAKRCSMATVVNALNVVTVSSHDKLLSGRTQQNSLNSPVTPCHINHSPKIHCF